jgi:hypothetical protein
MLLWVNFTPGEYDSLGAEDSTSRYLRSFVGEISFESRILMTV